MIWLVVRKNTQYQALSVFMGNMERYEIGTFSHDTKFHVVILHSAVDTVIVFQYIITIILYNKTLVFARAWNKKVTKKEKKAALGALG